MILIYLCFSWGSEAKSSFEFGIGLVVVIFHRFLIYKGFSVSFWRGFQGLLTHGDSFVMVLDILVLVLQVFV